MLTESQIILTEASSSVNCLHQVQGTLSVRLFSGMKAAISQCEVGPAHKGDTEP
jgi:hypothetical protein